MNDIAAAIGLSNLTLLDDTMIKHKSNGRYYDQALQNIPGVTLLTRHDDRESSHWIYTLRVENRDGFMKMMKEKGIEVSKVHERNDKHTCMKEFRVALPTLDVVADDMICIPVGWWVSDENSKYIIDCIKGGW
jgi:dTDP-4-amino-4,6-dideoxygalactose transaminase